MAQLIRLVILALVVCLMLPTIAQAAQAVVPALVGLLVLLGLAHLLWPKRRR
jgi:hypothetical protein